MRNDRRRVAQAFSRCSLRARPRRHRFLTDTMTTLAQDSIRKAQEQQSRYYNLKKKEATFQEGDYIMLSTKYIRPPSHTTRGAVKLCAKYIGPFRIIHLIGQNAYEL